MKKSVLFGLVVVAVSICPAQWLERQVVLGDTFGGIANLDGIVVNPVSGNAYAESRPIQVFNPSTLEKLRGPSVDGPVVFCPPSGKGYVLCESLVIIDAAADTVIGTTVLPFVPGAHVYNLTSNRLYMSSVDDSVLMVFDPEGDSVVNTVVVAGIEALLWDSVWNRLYVATSTDSAPWCPLLAFDCSTDTLLASIPTGFEDWHDLALSTASHKLYCSGHDTSDDGRLVVISTDSLKPVGAVPGVPDIDVMCYSQVTDRLYLADYEDVYAVDCRGDTIRALRYIEQGVAAMSLSSLTGRVYLGLYDTALVLVMDTTDSVVGEMRLPGTAEVTEDALAFSADRNELYGATEGSMAFVVDASVDTVVGTVSYLQVNSYQMVHNPSGNKLYVFCPDKDEVLVYDTTFGSPKRVAGGVYNASAVPVLNPTLNRIYVADGSRLRLIDCNSDSLLGIRIMYGTSSAKPVMVPYLNKLYVFSGSGPGDSVYAYDCLRDAIASVFYLTSYVSCAVYDPRSNRIFFACDDAPSVRVLDPVTNSVVKTFDLVGGSASGKMALNLDLGRLYYTDRAADRMFTIDPMADSVIASESLPWSIDALLLNRRLGKLYLCSQDTARVLVFDCGRGVIVDTIHADYRYVGLMDDINDKLYLRYGEVVDCRYDSIVTRLDSITARSMAWDAVGNRVFMAPTSWVYVYRDNPYGIADRSVGIREQRHATIVRGALFLPQASGVKRGASSILLDITGRKVLDLQPGANDVRALPAGVYFVRQAAGSRTTKVVIQR